jgi:hypothetical protein
MEREFEEVFMELLIAGGTKSWMQRGRDRKVARQDFQIRSECGEATSTVQIDERRPSALVIILDVEKTVVKYECL